MHRFASLALALASLCVPVAARTQQPRVLVFSKTAGFRHSSIGVGIAAVKKLGQENGFDVDATEDAGAFTSKNLARYRAVVWLNTTGDVLDNTQQDNFERYIQAGGGYVGVHAASDTRGKWPWYEGLVGARFTRHAPGTARATVRVEDRTSAATKRLPAAWTRTDEWYEFDRNPRAGVHVLATVDERTYSGGTMGADHPIAWCHRYDGGRSVYTAMGHTRESFSERRYLAHLLGAIEMAAGRARFNCAP